MNAAVLDELVDEFAPGLCPGGDFWIGLRDMDVERFYVAWSPAQIEGIAARTAGDSGAYVAYLGRVDEKTRALLSVALSRLPGLLVRFVGPAWRYHSWGVTGRIARTLGAASAAPAKVLGRETDSKVMTFLPAADVPRVREAVFGSGAGRYGLYSKCSFAAPGKGTFYGEKGSKPAVGEAGKFEEVEEERLEVRVPQEKLGRVISALRKAHPYEEPVIEVYVTSGGADFGEGRSGRLDGPLSVQTAGRRIASVLGSQPIFTSGKEQYDRVLIWDGEPNEGLYQAFTSGGGLYVGPDSRGLARVMARTSPLGIVEFPRYCFLLAGAKELVYVVRETSKREGWGVRTYLPTRTGVEGAH